MEEHYVDPSSGAAPQPGGFAGVHAAEKGFAIPADAEIKEEKSPAEYEAPFAQQGEQKTVSELAEIRQEQNPPAEKTEDEKQRVQALSNPQQVLHDLDDSGTTPEPAEDAQAVVDAEIEHEGVDNSEPEKPVEEKETPNENGDDAEGENAPEVKDEPKAPAKKAAAKKASSSKTQSSNG